MFALLRSQRTGGRTNDMPKRTLIVHRQYIANTKEALLDLTPLGLAQSQPDNASRPGNRSADVAQRLYIVSLVAYS